MRHLDSEKIARLLKETYPNVPGQWMELLPDGRLSPTVKQDRKNVSFVPGTQLSVQKRMKQDGMTSQQWTNILNGHQSDDVKLSTLFKMARILGVKPAELLMPPE